MSISQSLKSIVKALFAFLGVNIYFSSKRNKGDIVLFDRNALTSYYSGSKRLDLYKEGMKRSHCEWSDNFYKQCRFYSLQEMLEWVMKRSLEGDVAECGCWKGHSSYMIAKILSDNSFKGTFHIFDSFEEGLSDKTPEDKNVRFELSKKDIENEKKMFESTEGEVRDALSGFNFIKLYKGWIPERFSEADRCKFSFVHIDVDLYKPTLDSLAFFFPRLVTGGCIVIDDYGVTSFPGAKKAVDEFIAKNDCFMFYELPTGGCFIIK